MNSSVFVEGLSGVCRLVYGGVLSAPIYEGSN